MKRVHVNAGIDAVAFVGFLFLATTGMLLAYQLPPGSGGLEGHGIGPGAAARPVEMLWGLTRHEWGDIHYWIAVGLMGVLALHLVLHAKWIVCVVRGKPSAASPMRLALGVVGLVAVVALSLIPLLSATTTTTRGELQADSEESAAVRGSMTLGEIAEARGTSVEELIATLGLPADTSAEERAGPLLRRHGLQMSDLRGAPFAPPPDDETNR